MLRVLLTSACFTLAAGLPPAPAQAETAAQVAAEQTAQVGAATWINCASEGDHCYPDGSDLVTMRYGEGENFTYIIAQGLNRISCNNFWGNPADGKSKQCAFTFTNILNVAPNDTFATIANEGATFTLPDTGHIHWVRYGSGGIWMYTLMSGDGVSQMDCSNAYFNYDPVGGTDKICQYSSTAYYTLSDADDLTECATEGQACDLQTTDVVLMRYGADNTYNWRFLHAGDPIYPCNNETFTPDPIKVAKRCYWVSVDPSAISTFGYWSKQTSCQGAGCSISEEISVGTTRTNTWATSATWSATVTLSVKDSFSVLGTGEEVSESVASSFAASESFQSALSRSVMVSKTANCSPDGAESSRVLYQFQTGTTESCLQNVDCLGATFTSDYACISDPPANYQGPECVPGYCNPDDPLCQLPCLD